MKTNLSKCNLNLLIALDMLLTERHVTRAGEKLHLSQPAMSNILQQLRELFRDPLFIRGQASRMIATPRALALLEPVKAFIEQATRVMTQTYQFNPKTDKCLFTLGMSDYAEVVLLPELVKIIMDEAPYVDVVVKHMNYIQHANEFDNDGLDVAIGIYPKVPDDLIENILFSDGAVCVGSQYNNLLKKAPTEKVLAEAKQLLVLFYQSREELFSEQYFKSMGYHRRCVVTVPHTVSALYTVSVTNLIALVMKKVAMKVAQSLPLRIQPVPRAWPKVNLSMVWHSKYRLDPGHQWLRQKINQVAKLS